MIYFIRIITIAFVLLLVSGCDLESKSKETTDSGATTKVPTTPDTSSSSNTTDADDDNTPPTNPLTTLKIKLNKTSLNLGEKTSIAVTGTFKDNTTKELNDQVEWIITPKDSVKINNATLTTIKDNNTTIRAKIGRVVSNAVDLEIYWEVDGHKLPPEPDPTVNNSTLLGVDVNSNGVRDDVERYIYSRFMKDPNYPKTKTALAMQYAWATQKILENPVFESDKYTSDALACQSYWMNTKTEGWSFRDYIKFNLQHEVFDDTDLNDVMLNTKVRILQIFKHYEASSGNIIKGSPKTINSCQTNIDNLGE